MRFQTLVLLLLGAIGIAADSTVTLFIPGFEAKSVEGKVIGSNGSMTTYAISCAKEANPTDCAIPDEAGYTIAEGPSSMNYGFKLDNATITQSCTFQGTTQASCVGSSNETGVVSAMTTSFNVADIPYGGFQAVTITADSENSAASTGASASAATATVTGTSMAIITTAPGSTAQAFSAKFSNGIMPMPTGNARWVGGGIAMAMAFAVL